MKGFTMINLGINQILTADFGVSFLSDIQLFTLAEVPALPIVWWVAPIAAFCALFMARFFYGQVMKADEGTDLMQEIAGFVREGAMAYLTQQYRVVFKVFIVICGLLAIMAFVLHTQHKIVPLAFLTGGLLSGICGWLGMKTATHAAHRTAAGAQKSLNDGLVVAFRAGAVMGMVVVGFGLLDTSCWFLILRYIAPSLIAGFEMDLLQIVVVMLTFGMGASLQALFARVGGGIYTKAADVGADLVGKVEAGIPEDDPRNPATIADNVGDNVGDVAGMGADLYESYCGSILATMALGVAAASSIYGLDGAGDGYGVRLLTLPLALAGFGILLSVMGVFLVKTKEGASMGELMKGLERGVIAASLLIVVATFALSYSLLHEIPGLSWVGIAFSVTIGLVAGLMIGKWTEYCTSFEFGPTQNIAKQSETGSATVIIAGIAEGMKSTWACLAIIAIAILGAFISAGGTNQFMFGLYGLGLASVGMLSTLGVTLATDAYGPIADNAGGNAEMAGLDPEVRKRTDALDSLGNTTAATGKGFAIGSAALTALVLLTVYIEEVRIGQKHVVETAPVMQLSQSENGAVVYVGHGLFGVRSEADGKTIYDAYMWMNQDGILKWYDDSEAPFLSNGDALGGALTDAVKESSHVQMIDYNGKTLELVASRKADFKQFMLFYDVTLINPRVLCGMLGGVLLVFIFCAMTMEAVGRAAYAMMIECRDQFEQIKAYLKSQGHDDAYANDCENWPRRPVDYQGSKLPNYARCVGISTVGAQKEMIIPSLLAVAVPVGVGIILGVPGVMGLLVGGLCSGFAMAIFMANSGGAWDNAKKYVEMGNLGGKGSSSHKATVVGDTVGDPFKDTSGPSLNILIKLMGMVSVVFAGLVVKYSGYVAELLGFNH